LGGTLLANPDIIDPTKVVRIALENAAPVASVLLLTPAMLTDALEKEESRHAER
jgi:chaperonin GroEL (HSP60 family)